MDASWVAAFYTRDREGAHSMAPPVIDLFSFELHL
jgi:hypothetical protein